MKRSGAELPLCTWSGCGGRLNGVAVATVKRGGGGDAPHCVLSRCASIINGTACCLPAVLPRTLDANLRGAACGASLWAAECGMHVIWPCGGVRPREMRVEGHGSPRAINKCALLLCCFRSFYSSAAIPERSPTPLHYPLGRPRGLAWTFPPRMWNALKPRWWRGLRLAASSQCVNGLFRLPF
jgi:hypothetical protein